MTCSKFSKIAAARGIYLRRECERILARKNISDANLGIGLVLISREKQLCKNLCIEILVCSQKVVFLIICF